MFKRRLGEVWKGPDGWYVKRPNDEFVFRYKRDAIQYCWTFIGQPKIITRGKVIEVKQEKESWYEKKQ